MIRYVFIILLFTCTQALASAWPDNTVGGGFGVAAKPERTNDKHLRKIKASGFSYVRYDMRWNEVEVGAKGRYQWGAFDRFIKLMRDNHLKSVIILDDSNSLYMGNVKVPPELAFGATEISAAPNTKEAIDAFTAFAVAAVKRYGTDDILWEIWNEPDTVGFWPPRPNPEVFAKLASQVCNAIRNVEPHAKIIGPAMARFPSRVDLLHRTFFATFMQSQARDCIDAVTVHPYRSERQPETVIDDYKNKLRPFIKQYTAQGVEPLPVMNSEWGYSLTEASPQKQANTAMRIRLSDLIADVKLTILYEWQDSAAMSEEREMHFGMVDASGDDKEGNKYLSEIMPQIKDARFVRRIALGDSDAYAVLLHQLNGDNQVVAWVASDDANQHWQLKIKDQEAGDSTLDLSPRPQVVSISSPDVDVTVMKSDVKP